MTTKKIPEDSVNVLLQCPLCRVMLGAQNIDRHLVRVHCLGRPELLPDVKKVLLQDKREDELTCKCLFCKQTLKPSKLPGHLWRVHNELYVRSPLALKNIKNLEPSAADRRLTTVIDAQTGLANVAAKEFEAMLRTHRLVAKTVETCVCKMSIAYIDLFQGRHKAYDVDSMHRLIGAHSCDGQRSKSIYAFAGGAVDSNRRKH